MHKNNGTIILFIRNLMLGCVLEKNGGNFYNENLRSLEKNCGNIVFYKSEVCVCLGLRADGRLIIHVSGLIYFPLGLNTTTQQRPRCEDD